MVRRPLPSTLVTVTGLLLLLWITCVPRPPTLQPLPETSNVVSKPIKISQTPKLKKTPTSKVPVISTTQNIIVNKTKERLLTGDIYVAGYENNHSELCPSFGSNLRLIILITTAPSNFAQRNAIRMTWGHKTIHSRIALAFVIGNPPKAYRPLIEEENVLYGDIIVGRFVDSYRNLTLKSLSMLGWVNAYCHRVPRMLKTDDDMFINIPKLLDFVTSPSQMNMTKTIWGKLMKKRLPKRSNRSKYFVTTQQFSGKVYPDFLSGPAYLMTTDVISDILATAPTEPYLFLEDVFITGILASKLGVKRQHVTEFYNMKITDQCKVKRGIAVHKVNYNEQFDMWRKLQDKTMKC